LNSLDATLAFIQKEIHEHHSIVIYSSTAQLALTSGKPPEICAHEFVKSLLDIASGKTILMPTFTSGFDREGFISLDSAKSQTGLITQNFLNLHESGRTLSAFFSFAVQGPRKAELLDLKPYEAWGKGSVYEWIFDNDALIITVGLNPTHCSFTHYAEFLTESRIQYRSKKIFKGQIQRDGVLHNVEEILFVRTALNPRKNDFTWLAPHYAEAGQIVQKAGGVLVSAMPARKKIETILPFLSENPNALLLD